MITDQELETAWNDGPDFWNDGPDFPIIEINGKQYKDVTNEPMRYANPKGSFLEKVNKSHCIEYRSAYRRAKKNGVFIDDVYNLSQFDSIDTGKRFTKNVFHVIGEILHLTKPY